MCQCPVRYLRAVLLKFLRGKVDGHGSIILKGSSQQVRDLVTKEKNTSLGER